MRRAAIFVAALAFAPTATAAPPAVHLQLSTSAGPAPLQVTLSASGDLASYHWEFGDGASADGAVVQHVFGAGRFTVRVTATAPNGESAQAQAAVTSLALTLKGPRVVRYGRHARFRGRLVPAIRGMRVRLYLGDRRVASGRTRRDGSFRIGAPIGAPGAYVARFAGAASNPVQLLVRPVLTASFSGSGLLRRPLWLRAAVRPLAAGPLRVRVWRRGRLLLDVSTTTAARVRFSTAHATTYRIRLSVVPHDGFLGAGRTLTRAVFPARLARGSTGPAVRALEARLAELHYALRGVDASYGFDTADAVVAFQKVHGLARTGEVGGRVWRALLAASVPRARYPGDHIEVDKGRQVLFVVRGGKVMLISHVSTGATGNTPVGRWHVYSKVAGWLPSGMFDSSFFTGAFAIHGYPSVPYYPASHGCVRLPLWLAPRIYALDPVGTEVDIYN